MSGPSGQQVFAIKCSRSSKVVEWDEETFTDCYKEEIDDAEETVKDGAAAGDGVWYYDTADPYQRGFYLDDLQNKWFMRRGGGYDKSRGPDRPANLTVFPTVEAANAQAALVFAEMQRNYPFVDLESSGSEGEEGASEDLASSDSEGDDEASEDLASGDSEGEEDSEPAPGRKRGRPTRTAGASAGQAKRAKRSSQVGAGAAEVPAAGSEGSGASEEDSEQYKTVQPDGRACWKCEQRYFCDPYNPNPGDECQLKNVVSSKISVEVVPATLAC